MRDTWRGPDNVVPICPHCQSNLTFVGSWNFRGLWGYNEVSTYECPTHGPIFIAPETSIGARPGRAPDKAPDEGDRDALAPARRKPTPTLNADAIAIPEPDSN
jgi:hypothetical protein